MATQNLASRKRSVKLLSYILPTLVVEEVTIKSEFNSELIH